MPVKRHFRLILIILLILAVSCSLIGIYTYLQDTEFSNRGNNSDITNLPPVYFFTKNDKKKSLEDFKGKYVLVNLWATWCPPCVAELPSLDTLQAKLRDKNFEVVAIALDRTSIMNVMSFLRHIHIEHLNVYWDKERQIPMKWEYDGIPVSFLLDQDGKVIQKFNGPYEWHTGPTFRKIQNLVTQDQ